ncbi:Hypothetical predicted protein [Octopus vulgaris]|uniref:Uncharacterized protein n=1 Tax=Octopus vulgaris TaxID=6645 RepID=A0AA36AQB3_OCTVU|nr:Hypothetical predicted protein [Octopus vulgaris]
MSFRRYKLSFVMERERNKTRLYPAAFCGKTTTSIHTALCAFMLKFFPFRNEKTHGKAFAKPNRLLKTKNNVRLCVCSYVRKTKKEKKKKNEGKRTGTTKPEVK